MAHEQERALFAVKLAHTVIFVFMAGCVFYVLYCGIVGRDNTPLYAANVRQESYRRDWLSSGITPAPRQSIGVHCGNIERNGRYEQ